MTKAKINLWLDDERPAPEGWVHAKTAGEARHHLLFDDVQTMSLDHDLGTCGPTRCPLDDEDYHVSRLHNCACATGYDLLVWMAGHDTWPRKKPSVHSQNPVGAFAMRQIIDRYFPG